MFDIGRDSGAGSIRRRQSNVWAVLGGHVRHLDWLGRMMVASLFLWNGVARYVLAWPESVDAIRAAGMPIPETIAAAAGAVEIVGAIALLVPMTEGMAAGMLACYCIGTALVMRSALDAGATGDFAQTSVLLKDLALAGGLTALALRPVRS